MQRKPGFPVANCNIKMPDGMPVQVSVPLEDDVEQVQRRQQLINFGHAQWGFNNWSWSVSKQDLDFVDFSNGKYCAGVVAFVSVVVKSCDIHRENIGYATSVAMNKGSAIHKSRKCAVTNALRETLLSFGGNVASELLELLESTKTESVPQVETLPENNPNLANKLPEPKNSKSLRKDSSESGSAVNHRMAPPAVKNIVPPVATAHPMPANVPPVATAHPVTVPPVATAHPMPASVPPAAPPHHRPRPPPPAARPNSNVVSGAQEKSLEGMTEEEARAERKRRQQKAQEEFRLRQQLAKQKHDDKQDLHRASSSFDKMLMDIPTQDIEIEQTGEDEQKKRKSPAPETSSKRRPGVLSSKLDIVTD